MPIMKVIRDKDGALINIGGWDYQIERRQLADPETGDPIFDLRESGGFVARTEQYAQNPLPEGAYEDEADIVVGEGGGLYEAQA